MGVAAQSTDWNVVGTGDFNGDGNSDILWRNDDGYVGMWEMNGTQVQSGGGVAAESTDWNVVGVGDFNGDGDSDILWRNDDGYVGMWLMDGTQVQTGGGVAAGVDRLACGRQ